MKAWNIIYLPEAIYRLIRTEHGMEIIVIGARADSEVYEEAVKRLKQKKWGCCKSMISLIHSPLFLVKA